MMNDREGALTEHELKTCPEPFQAVLQGVKRHETRKDDRDFKVGDTLLLREWTPERPGRYVVDGTAATWVNFPARYTGRWARCRILYMTRARHWGVPDGLCMMSIDLLEEGVCIPS
jgi:hypothetical protein